MKINKNVSATFTSYEDFQILGIEAHDEFTGEDHKIKLDIPEIASIEDQYTTLKNKESKQISSTVKIEKEDRNLKIRYHDEWVGETDTVTLKQEDFTEILNQIKSKRRDK